LLIAQPHFIKNLSAELFNFDYMLDLFFEPESKPALFHAASNYFAAFLG